MLGLGSGALSGIALNDHRAGAWIEEAVAHRTAWETACFEDDPAWLDLMLRHEAGEVGDDELVAGT